MNQYKFTLVFGSQAIEATGEGPDPATAFASFLRGNSCRTIPTLVELNNPDGTETLLISPGQMSVASIKLIDGEPNVNQTGPSNIVIPVAGLDPRVEAEVRQSPKG